jgi:hypothetical protein
VSSDSTLYVEDFDPELLRRLRILKGAEKTTIKSIVTDAIREALPRREALAGLRPGNGQCTVAAPHDATECNGVHLSMADA